MASADRGRAEGQQKNPWHSHHAQTPPQAGAGGAQPSPAAAPLWAKDTAGGGEVPARQPDVRAMVAMAGGTKAA